MAMGLHVYLLVDLVPSGIFLGVEFLIFILIYCISMFVSATNSCAVVFYGKYLQT